MSDSNTLVIVIMLFAISIGIITINWNLSEIRQNTELHKEIVESKPEFMSMLTGNAKYQIVNISDIEECKNTFPEGYNHYINSKQTCTILFWTKDIQTFNNTGVDR